MSRLTLVAKNKEREQNNSSVTKIEHLSGVRLFFVIPATAGIQAEKVLFNWIPAFAGMTIDMDCYVLVTLKTFFATVSQ